MEIFLYHFPRPLGERVGVRGAYRLLRNPMKAETYITMVDIAEAHSGEVVA
jgi:hypothetical protein